MDGYRNEKEEREALKFVLEQIFRENRRKEQLERRLENIKRNITSPPAASDKSGRRPKGSHGDGTAEIVVKKTNLEERIEKQVENIDKLTERTMGILELLPETSLEREIVELRHIDMMKWKDIADSTHMSRSQCNRRYNQAIEDLIQYDTAREAIRENMDAYIRYKDARTDHRTRAMKHRRPYKTHTSI